MNHAKREGVEAVWTTRDECLRAGSDQITVISDACGCALPEMGFTLGGVRELRSETRILVARPDHTIHAATCGCRSGRDGQVIGLRP